MTPGDFGDLIIFQGQIRRNRQPPQKCRRETRQQIGARFGNEFADAVFALPEARWSDPLASPFGLHLVWVERHAPERIPALEEVRDRVILSWRHEQREAHLAQALAALRARYDVVVEDGSTTEARSG